MMFRGCLVAQNGGFFDTETYACLGNVISEGKTLMDTGVQNVNFGITYSGQIITGLVM